MEYEVRRLEVDDHCRLRVLRLRALAGAPTAFGTTLAEAEAMPESEWRHRLRPDGFPHFGGFDQHGALVGMAAGLNDRGQPGVAHLVGMWVEPPARGSGLADELVGRVLAWAVEQGCHTVRLTVTAGNDRAESLYRRLGFERTGGRQVRERDGLVEVEMARPIS